MANSDSAATRGNRFIDSAVNFFERAIPDPFVLVVLITFIITVASLLIAPNGSISNVIGGWHKGFFGILKFAFQITLMLVMGHALANAPPVQAFFRRIIGLARTPRQAAVLIFYCVAAAAFFNWALGLVISALLAREVARRMDVDFAWIVAAAYSGWFSQVGVSSSIALAQSTHGSEMNVVEKLTGQLLTFHDLIFTPFNLVPLIVLLIVLPVVICLIKPSSTQASQIGEQTGEQAPPAARAAPAAGGGFARRVEYSVAGTVFIALLGAGFLALVLTQGVTFSGIDAMIFILFMAGVILHRYPIHYAQAIKSAAQHSGSVILQYPMYGGVMGIMAATGLAGVIANGFIAISTTHTLPFWSFICSVIVTFFIPSGGGHWAVQGPLVIPAAVHLHASYPATTMAVAMGEEASNMLQPFWIAPVVAMASGVKVQRVLGFTMITFLIELVVFSVSLLLLA